MNTDIKKQKQKQEQKQETLTKTSEPTLDDPVYGGDIRIKSEPTEKLVRTPGSKPQKPSANDVMIIYEDSEEDLRQTLPEETNLEDIPRSLEKDDEAINLVVKEALAAKRKTEVANKLSEPSGRIRNAYNSSANLRRDLREKADKLIAKTRKDLSKVTNSHSSAETKAKGDDDGHDILFSWPNRMGEVLLLVTSSYRFSGDIVTTMEHLRDHGQWVINRWCNDEPLNLSQEEIDRKRKGWGSLQPSYTRRRKREQLDSSKEEEEPDPEKGRRTRKKTRTPSTFQQEGSEDSDSEGRMGEDRNTETGSKKRIDDPAQNNIIAGAQRDASPPNQDIDSNRRDNRFELQTGEHTQLTNARGWPIAEEGDKPTRATVLIHAEGKSYIDLIKDLKKRISTHDISIRGIRKTFSSENAIVETENRPAADTLADRVKDAGYTASILGKRKAKIAIVGIEPTATVDDVIGGLSSVVDTSSVEVLNLKKTQRGEQLASIQVSPATAAHLIRVGKLQVGWSQARVRKFTETTGCYRCGELTHRAITCRSHAKLCFACKEPGHIRSECPAQGLEEVAEPIIDVGATKVLPPLRKTTVEPSANQLNPKLGPSREEKIAACTSISDPYMSMKLSKNYRTIGTQTPGTWTRQIEPHPTWSHGQAMGRPSYARMVEGGGWEPTERRSEADSKQPGSRTEASTRQMEKNTGGGTNPRTGRIKKKRRPAILAEIQGKTYQETLAVIKATIPPPKGESNIQVARSRTGAVIISLGEESQAKELARIINKSGRIKARYLGDRVTAKLRDLDALVEPQDIIEAIRAEAPPQDEQEDDTIEVVRLFIYPWGEKAAVIKIPRHIAGILEKGEGSA